MLNVATSHREAGHVARVGHEELGGLLRAEARVRDRALAVGVAEGDETDDRDRDRVGGADRGGVAHRQVALLGGGHVDHDLAGRLGGAALAQVVGVEAVVGDPVAALGRGAVAAERVAVGADDAGAALDARRDGGHPLDAGELVDECPVDQAPLGEVGLADLAGGADEGVGAGVGRREHVAEALGHRVAEHERARQERDPQQDRGAGAQEAPLVGAERLEGGLPHGGQLPKPFSFSSTRSAVGSIIPSTTRPSARNTTASA
jgi:hypothetical protein